MLSEIIAKYEQFSDALILEIIYREFEHAKMAEVVVECMNRLNDYKFETIKLTFIDIISFRFNENEKQSSTVINTAFISNDNGIIIFDFFPLLYGGNDLKENVNSDFKIKCWGINYTKITEGY